MQFVRYKRKFGPLSAFSLSTVPNLASSRNFIIFVFTLIHAARAAGERTRRLRKTCGSGEFICRTNVDVYRLTVIYKRQRDRGEKKSRDFQRADRDVSSLFSLFPFLVFPRSLVSFN